MDRNTIIGLVLIVAIFVGFQIINAPSKEEIAAAQAAERRYSDSLALVQEEQARKAADTSASVAQQAVTDPFIARPVKFFMGFGGQEFDNDVGNQLMVGLCRMVDRNLRNQGYDDAHLRFVLTPDARHNEDAWALRLPEALAFLFGDWKAP